MKTTSQKPLTTNARLRDVGVYMILAAATLIAYEQVRLNDFVNYDDTAYVTENREVLRGMEADSILWAFTASHAGNWHPMTWLSHMLDCQLFGTNASGHHLTSLLIHVANSMLLLWVLRRMTGALWPSAFVAFAFALHPIHVESVAWVAERKDVLSALFWMLTMAAYVRYTRRRSVASYLLVSAAFALGLMAKPMLVTLPFVLLLIDYWPLGRSQTRCIEEGSLPTMPNAKANRRRRRLPNARANGQTPPNTIQGSSWLRLLMEKVPMAALAMASCIVTFIVQHKAGAVASRGIMPVVLRMANIPISYMHYILKLIWPTGLAVLYPHPETMLFSAEAIVCFILLLLITALLIYLAVRHNFVAGIIGWLWYLGTLVPVIGLVQVGEQAMADRYTYIPSIGIFIIVAFAAARLAGRSPALRVVLAGAIVIIPLVWVAATRAQVLHWRDSIALCSRAIAVTKDNAVMHNNLANVLRDDGKVHEAIGHYQKALEIRPLYVRALSNLGAALNQQGKSAEAMEYHLKALKINPSDADTHCNMATALHLQGDLVESMKHYRLALQADPDYSKACNNLAWILATAEEPDLRDPGLAVELATKACILTDYSNADQLDTLAVAFAATGRFDEAAETAQKALAQAMADEKNDLAEQVRERLGRYKQGKP